MFTEAQTGTLSPLPYRVRPAPDILMREVDGEAVLLNLSSGRYFGLDPVGTRMWLLLTAADSVEDGCAQLVAEYEVAPEVLRADVAQLIHQLAEQGLLEVHAS